MENKWISVDDKLPEMGLPVLTFREVNNSDKKIVRMNAINVLCLFIKASNNILVWDYTFCESTDLVELSESGFKNITHWQPLPEPPKE